MTLEDRQGGRHVRRGLPRDASGQKFLTGSGKEGDVTELMTPVRALLKLEVTKPERRRLRATGSEVPDREWQGGGRHGVDDPRPGATETRG